MTPEIKKIKNIDFMKKTAIIAGAVSFLLITASVNAQTDSTKQPAPVETQTPATPVETQTPVVAPTQAPATTTTTVSTTASMDKYNNYDKAKYAMLPMPEPLTTEKIFPVIGKYELKDKDGVASQATITLDETNKGLVWVDGLPQGRIKAQLRQSPATYKIPEQKLGEEKDAATVAEGVLIYDKDANTLNVCVGCKYNVDDPNSTFVTPQEVVEQPVTKTKTKNGAVAKSKTKVKKVKPIMYTGTKLVEGTASVQPQQ
jgi:hypothetical protein